MRIKLLFTGILCATLTACGDEVATTDEPKVIEVEAVIPEEDLFNYDTLRGMYIGDFGGSEIRIILNYVSQKNAIGYNIHKGLQRNLNGKVRRSGDSIQLVLNEPGDNQFDGVFTLDFMGEDDRPSGVWVSGSGKIPKQNFKLSRVVPKEFNSEDPVDITNFANYFGFISDSIGEYRFKENGLCIFKYYPKTSNGEISDQLQEIKGSWSLKGKNVTIDWQPNKVFKTGKMVLEVFKNEWEEVSLKGKNHEFYNYYYGP